MDAVGVKDVPVDVVVDKEMVGSGSQQTVGQAHSLVPQVPGRRSKSASFLAAKAVVPLQFVEVVFMFFLQRVVIEEGLASCSAIPGTGSQLDG